MLYAVCPVLGGPVLAGLGNILTAPLGVHRQPSLCRGSRHSFQMRSASQTHADRPCCGHYSPLGGRYRHWTRRYNSPLASVLGFPFVCRVEDSFTLLGSFGALSSFQSGIPTWRSEYVTCCMLHAACVLVGFRDQLCTRQRRSQETAMIPTSDDALSEFPIRQDAHPGPLRD